MPSKPNNYTRHLFLYNEACDLELMVKPDADLDGSFMAWDCIEEVLIRVNGWLFQIDEEAASL